MAITSSELASVKAVGDAAGDADGDGLVRDSVGDVGDGVGGVPSVKSATVSNAGVAAFAFPPDGDDGDGLVRDGARDVGDGVGGAAVNGFGDVVKCWLVWRHSRLHQVVMTATVSSEMVSGTSATASQALPSVRSPTVCVRC